MILKRIIQNKEKVNLVAASIVFIVFFGYFFFLLYRHTSSDIQAHAKIAYSYAVNDDRLFPNFLYFFLVALLAGFSKNLFLYYGASIFLLSTAIVGKFIITDFYLKKYSLHRKDDRVLAICLATSMLFVFALPGINFFQTNEYYLGQLPPNVWHNSTVIFLMPFSVLLFFKSYNFLFTETKDNNKEQLQILLLIILNALIKPSFLFTLIPSVFLFFGYSKIFPGKSGKKFRLLVPFLAGLLFIAIEYYLIYNLGHISKIVNSDKEAGVAIEPFVVWSNYSPNTLVAFLTSCFFPIVYCIVSKGAIFKEKMVQFATVNYIMGLSIWILFAEQGYRKFDANFCWQLIVASYLLFLSFLIQFVNDCRQRNIGINKQYIIGGAFLLHFIWGLVYWVKIIIFRGYF